MNEYKVTITMRDNTGFIPDFVGTKQIIYRHAESAAEVEKSIEAQLEAELGMEIEEGEISYSLNIERV